MVSYLNFWVKFANFEADMLRPITFPPYEETKPPGDLKSGATNMASVRL